MRSVALATVDDDADAVDIGADGVWLDVTLTETGEKARARWGLRVQPGGAGVWAPPPRPRDEVVVVFDGADPRSAYAVAILASSDTEEGDGSWALPQAILDNPNAVHVLSPDRLRVVAPLTVVDSDEIQLGDGATREVARKFDDVSVGGLYDAAWVAWRTAMTAAGLPTPPLAIAGKVTSGSSVSKSL